MATATRTREKSSVLSHQDIRSRRKALKQQKLQVTGTGRRAILAVVSLTLSTLALLGVATWDAHDRVGPGFHNWIGPVGHALGETLRGLLGVCAWVLPLAGLYASYLIVTGEKDKRRWPQLVCLALLLVSGSVFAQLALNARGYAHAPGGALGQAVGGALVALFSQVGTVVLAAAVATVALIVGTQFAFLRLCALAASALESLGKKAFVAARAAFFKARERFAAQREQRAKAKEEEAAFLAQLEEEEAELDELEAAAREASEVVDENQAQLLAARAARDAKLIERETNLLERDRLRAEREALKAGREAQREAERLAKELEKQPLQMEAQPTAPAPEPVPLVPLAGEDPAWAAAFAPAAAPQAASAGPVAALVQQISQPPQRTAPMPLIVQPPPPPPEAFLSIPPRAMQSENAAPVALSMPLESMAPPQMQAGDAMATPLIVEPKAPPKPTTRRVQEQFEFLGGRTSFVVPPMDVLKANDNKRTEIDKNEFYATAEKLRAKLLDFKIDGQVVEIRPGPVITTYEYRLAPGIKISRVASLADDLAMAMEAQKVRIVAPIPGKNAIGIEVPNREREAVVLKEIAEQDNFMKSSSKLALCLGKDIEGMPYVVDLAKAPHLLIAGTTGSGKSVGMNSMIVSMLLKATPEEVRFIMVDPKQLELAPYDGIPHMLLPVVTDPRKAALALQWAVDEMERRYTLLAKEGVRHVNDYNRLVDAEKKTVKGTVVKKAVVTPPKPAEVLVPPPAPVAAKPPEPAPSPIAPSGKKRKLLIVDVGEETPAVEATTAVTEAAPATEIAAPAVADLGIGVPAPVEAVEDMRVESPPEETEGEIRIEEITAEERAALDAAAEAADGAEVVADRHRLPYIVVVIDELADLMMVAAKEIETSIARIAQKARAAGIHLIVATQRPSTDIITGVIKANFPTRISFRLASKHDSMTILNTVGAEKLLGMGDMLLVPPNASDLVRVHGCYVSDAEITKAVDHLKAQGKPVYDESILVERAEDDGASYGAEDATGDDLYDKAIAFVATQKTISVSLLQRRMGIGYNKSANLIERMEKEGIVAAANGAKPRAVLIGQLGQMSAPMM